MSLVEMLQCGDLPEHIAWGEVEVLSRAASGGDLGSWETLCSQDRVMVSKAATESRTSNVTFRVDAELPGVPIELAADQLCCFGERCRWDPYIVGTRVHAVRPASEQEVPANLFYYVVHAPPFADRDAVTQIVASKSSGGDAMFTYCRSVDHPGYPAGRMGRIRAHMNGTFTVIRRDPADPERSSRLMIISGQDIKLPFVPSWLVSYFMPSKLVDIMQRLRRAAQRRRAQVAQGASLPCEAFFGGAPAARPQKTDDEAERQRAEPSWSESSTELNRSTELSLAVEVNSSGSTACEADASDQRAVSHSASEATVSHSVTPEPLEVKHEPVLEELPAAQPSGTRWGLCGSFGCDV
jgi:hypothetical protein